ncbi:NADH-quinone oxidoreductase subunit C [Streptomyces sp. NBC_00272]|uniref:NADH-quinone oxidoreductase subunit C n=1 Tax=Streptomyces sp. NBC_00272 TaxID=2975698 RepID=UPI002E28AFF6|nr:NADH-quinone oxidoreductase subunit C [Streptomyces sp. NBC_00272]
MNLYDSLPDAAATVFGAEAVAEHAYDLLTVDVPVGSWIAALEIARDKLGCTYFDWLSAVDEPGTGFRICAHVVSLENHRVRRLLLRTTVPHSAPSLPSAVAVYAGAEWHERETFEMFGVVFTDHPHLVPLLLPENFEGHPLRKDFVLAARVAKAWPGAKEPGEAHDPDAPKRRQMLPPGVPDPNDWGPLKGQLPPAPARPARTARAPREGAPVRRSVTEGSATQSAEAEAAAPRPARRTRSVSEGSASQAVPAAEPETEAAAPRPARRTRSVSEGSASQAVPAAEPETEAAAPRPARRTRSVSEGSASQAVPSAEPGAEPEAPRPDSQAVPSAEPEAEADEARPRRTVAPGRRPAPRSADAPWHNPQPAFADRDPEPEPEREPKTGPGDTPEPEPEPDNGGDA